MRSKTIELKKMSPTIISLRCCFCMALSSFAGLRPADPY